MFETESSKVSVEVLQVLLLLSVVQAADIQWTARSLDLRSTAIKLQERFLTETTIRGEC